MPNDHQPTEGYASVQYKLVVAQKRTLIFNAQVVVFLNAELYESVYSASTGLHTFRTLDPNFLESVKQVMSNANPVLEFRLGYGTPNNMFWLPWQRHIVVNYTAKFEGIAATSGHLISFVTANELTRMARSNKLIARKGTIANLVAAIAAENSLAAVIEPTDGEFMLYQSYSDDTSFIRERLLPRAARRGRGGFYFFLRDNVLHFHTPDYQSTARRLDYYSVFGTELTLTDRSQDAKLWDAGLAGVRVIAQNPYTGQTQEIESDPAKALRLADSIYDYASVNNGQQNVPYHLSQNPSTEVNALAQSAYQHARQKALCSTVSVDKTIQVRHGDLVNLSVTQQKASASSHSGYYYVTSALHVISKQSVNSTYTLERGEVRGQDQSLSTQNAQEQLIPTSEAPGEDPNIREIQSSELTKGAGKQSSATTYTVVTDVNTGLPKT